MEGPPSRQLAFCVCACKYVRVRASARVSDILEQTTPLLKGSGSHSDEVLEKTPTPIINGAVPLRNRKEEARGMRRSVTTPPSLTGRPRASRQVQ